MDEERKPVTFRWTYPCADRKVIEHKERKVINGSTKRRGKGGRGVTIPAYTQVVR